jgi:hypothetical protein
LKLELWGEHGRRVGAGGDVAGVTGNSCGGPLDQGRWVSVYVDGELGAGAASGTDRASEDPVLVRQRVARSAVRVCRTSAQHVAGETITDWRSMCFARKEAGLLPADNPSH